MLIDTHAHLDFPEFAGELDAILARAAEAGVTRIITISTDLESSARAVAIAEKFPQVFAAIGVHPNHADEAPADLAERLRALARNPKVVAIGEAGLDYHRLPSVEQRAEIDAVKSVQAVVFQQQLELAAELGLNVIIHERDAWSDTLALLEPFAGRLRGVFHCFGKTIEQARAVIAHGHLVSFTGIVTFKNAPVVHEAAALVPAGAFMVETDCPFLAPAPHRGKRCEPAHTRLVAERLAQLRGVPLAEIAAQTTATAEAFFRFPK